MNSTPEKKSSPLSAIVIAAVVLILLLVVAMFVQRSRYPDGTFLHQQRTYFEEELNPNLPEVIQAVVPGETTTAALIDKVGEPSAKVEKGGLELWVYTTRTVKVTDRRLFGLIRTGGSTDSVESQMPFGVKDGVVVHTYVTPSKDPAIKSAVESMWDAFTPGA